MHGPDEVKAAAVSGTGKISLKMSLGRIVTFYKKFNPGGDECSLKEKRQALDKIALVSSGAAAAGSGDEVTCGGGDAGSGGEVTGKWWGCW